MPLFAIDSDATWEYSLLEERSAENPTIFVLGSLDTFTRAYIDDLHLTLKRNGSPTPEIHDHHLHQKYIQFVKFGLKDWRNFLDKEGKEIPLETEEIIIPGVGRRTVVSDKCLKKLLLPWIVELGYEIVSHNRISEEEKKKLTLQSGPSSNLN